MNHPNDTAFDAVAQVARGLGHELGNLLTRITGKTELAMEENDLAATRAHLVTVLSTCERATLVVKNLQALTGKKVLSGPANIYQLIERAIHFVGNDARKANVEMRLDLDHGIVAEVDAEKLRLAVSNVLLNAIQEMRTTGGVVNVSLTRDVARTGFEIRVLDSGRGIAPDVLPRIFDFGFSTKGDSGSGLGLSITKYWVEAHLGELVVESVLGKGTLIRMFFPDKQKA